jgi:hypothetical protein
MAGERASLDAALLAAGEDIILRRRTMVGDVVTDTDVVCRARVDTVNSNEIAGTIAVSDLKVIISPTELLAANWPDGTGSPPRTTDFIVARGKLRQIKVVDPKIIGDEGLCRINLIAAG